MPLDASVGGANSNSYVSRSDADTYFSMRLHASVWSDASTEDQERALVSATRMLEVFRFKGKAASSNQALKWPRVGVKNDDGTGYLAGDQIPRAIRDATCDVALQLLKTDPTDEVSEELKQFKRLKLPGVEIETRDSYVSEGQLTSEVLRKISHLFAAGPGMTRLIRG